MPLFTKKVSSMDGIFKGWYLGAFYRILELGRKTRFFLLGKILLRPKREFCFQGLQLVFGYLPIGGGAEHRNIYLDIGTIEICLADVEGFGYGLQGITLGAHNAFLITGDALLGDGSVGSLYEFIHTEPHHQARFPQSYWKWVISHIC